jgi:hypothetical protein
MAPRTLTGRLTKKLLMSFTATAVTGVAGYAGRKAPQLIEDKLMPKLRDTTPPPRREETKKSAERSKPKRRSSAQLESRRRQRAARREARRTGSGPKED